jgi:choline-glycine betaine transporter
MSALPPKADTIQHGGSYRPFGVGLVLIGSGVVWLWFSFLGPMVLKRVLRED